MNRPSVSHCDLQYFPTVDGCLHAGGEPITGLAKRLEGTPFYAYDKALIDQRIHQLREKLPKDIKLHYAIKANPMPELVKHLASQVDGFDVASQGELGVALQAEMSPKHISFTGPGKDTDELRAAIEADIILNIEPEGEMLRIASLANETGKRPRVTVRVNPDFELKSSGMRMGGGAKPFGIDAEQIPELLQQLGKLDLAFLGFHIYSGSQNLHAEAIIEAQNETLTLALRLAEWTPSPVQLINLGGGFGIPYFPGDQPLDITPVGDNLAQLRDRARAALPEAALVLELGRYLVGEAGIYVCRVIDKKVSRGQTFLVTDGGMHHHLAASGNFGQVIRKNYPLVIGNKMNSNTKEVVTVVGRLCTPLDVLADKMELPSAEVGDLVVILQSGAYGFSASPMAFLGHPVAKEILV